MKKAVLVEKAPKPVGPYSQAICVEGWLFISGQIPIDPATGSILAGDFKASAERVLANIKEIVEGAGGTMDSIVKVTVYLKDLSKFQEFNEVYSKFFKQPYPARSVVQVEALPRNADLEVEAIAWLGKCPE